MRILFLVFILIISCTVPGTSIETPTNIILFIGDGMGDNHIHLTSLYISGKADGLAFHKFPLSLYVSTYANGSEYNSYKAWTDFNYVKSEATDSAAAATAIACGVKTANGELGTRLGAGVQNILELAESKNMSTGIVTSVPISHATPAAFSVHINDRNQYPRIAEYMLNNSSLDVLMGGGHPFFTVNGLAAVNVQSDAKYVGGIEMWSSLKAGTVGGDRNSDGIDDPWLLIENKEDFVNLASGLIQGRAVAGERVLGIFQTAATLQQQRDDSDNVIQVHGDPKISNVPDLDTMVLGSLNILKNNPKGFILVVEGGAIDWASHGNQADRVIEEVLDFNNAISGAIEWLRIEDKLEDTLIIVTADHETGYLNGPVDPLEPVRTPPASNGIHNIPVYEWHSTGHTNQLVPLYSRGPGSDFFYNYISLFDSNAGPYIDNTAIHHVLRKCVER